MQIKVTHLGGGGGEGELNSRNTRVFWHLSAYTPEFFKSKNFGKKSPEVSLLYSFLFCWSQNHNNQFNQTPWVWLLVWLFTSHHDIKNIKQVVDHILWVFRKTVSCQRSMQMNFWLKEHECHNIKNLVVDSPQRGHCEKSHSNQLGPCLRPCCFIENPNAICFVLLLFLKEHKQQNKRN